MKLFPSRYSLVFGLVTISVSGLWAQSSSSGNANSGGGLGTATINNQSYAVTTAVPFLRIAPDARMSGMGDAGIALQPDSIADPDGAFLNPAKVCYNTKPYAFAMSYTPWLRQLVNDIDLAEVSGYEKINKVQAIDESLRFFSLGQIQFTNVNGENTGQFRPNEWAADVHYSRILAEGFSAGVGLRFIYSNLATGQTVNGLNITPGIAASGDIAFYYNHPFNVGGTKTNLAFGLNLSNLGSKISYTSSTDKDFIPMNMGWGTSWQVNVDRHNMITVVADANKLLVPTPSNKIDSATGQYAYLEESVPEGIISSFYDAPNGVKQEFQEVTWQFGVEYWYDKLFAVRAGYFYEYPNEGDRQFFTAGVGLRYSIFGLDFSYLIPSSNIRNPLDNTLQFTLVFAFNKAGTKPGDAPVDNVKTSSILDGKGNPTSVFPF